MASIKKNPNGSYSATVYVGRDVNDKMVRKYITAPSLKECKIKVRELEEDIENKSLNNLSNMKMTYYMDKWIEVNKATLSSTTIKAYKIYINKHFKPYFGNKKVSQISEMNIKEYISIKLKTLSSTTVRKHFFTLSRILKDALKVKSPCIGVKPPKNADTTPTIPTEEQFNEIYQAFKEISLEDEIIILLAGWCGLRRGEVFALKWEDLNKENGTIRIDEAVALEEDGYKFVLKAPKSDNGIRTIACPDYLLDQLDTLKQAIPKNNIISHSIFKQNPHSFTKKYIRIIKQKNLTEVRFHDLRHYHASLLYKNNVPDLYAAERLGHDIMVLKKIYQHLGLKEKQDIDQKVKDIFK